MGMSMIGLRAGTVEGQTDEEQVVVKYLKEVRRTSGQVTDELLTARFIACAKVVAAARGIRREAFEEYGVDATVLKQAGVASAR
jgi:hypothetical protein